MATNPNMVAIQTVTVGSGGAANIEFTNIPQTYTDLKLVVSARDTFSATANAMYLQVNGAGGTAYSIRRVQGNGSAASSYSETGQSSANYYSTATGASATASTFGNFELYIPNYAGSNAKSMSVDAVTENNGTTAFASMYAGLTTNTAAITSITLSPDTAFAQYSTATLYGVTSAGTAAKATGGIITMDENYFYHTFLASGTFTPTQNLTADYLVVAGGGGGGSRGGGGGGAGGMRCTVTATGGGGSLESPLSLTANTGYTVTIGAGGAGGSRAVAGANGSDSVFSTITSSGGGYGGSAAVVPNTGNNGGSGGGGSNNGVGGTGTTNQGYAGGSSNNTSYDGGGGGGAGAVGANASTAGIGLGSGNGGNGVATSISGTSTTYAGGGGGGSFGSSNHGTGGTGGGGNGANTAPTAGTANTGGGGGGAGNSANTNTTPAGAAGGSGIVIVRYAR